MVAVDVFFGWGNEILSTWSIVCPAMKHSWLLSLRELVKLQKTLSLSPLSGFGGEGKEGDRRVMFLVHEPDVLFLYHCSEKLRGEKQKLPWAVLKNGFWCESGLGLKPSSATYKLCDWEKDYITPPSLNTLLCKRAYHVPWIHLFNNKVSMVHKQWLVLLYITSAGWDWSWYHYTLHSFA